MDFTAFDLNCKAALPEERYLKMYEAVWHQSLNIFIFDLLFEMTSSAILCQSCGYFLGCWSSTSECHKHRPAVAHPQSWPLANLVMASSRNITSFGRSASICGRSLRGPPGLMIFPFTWVYLALPGWSQAITTKPWEAKNSVKKM